MPSSRKSLQVEVSLDNASMPAARNTCNIQLKQKSQQTVHPSRTQSKQSSHGDQDPQEKACVEATILAEVWQDSTIVFALLVSDEAPSSGSESHASGNNRAALLHVVEPARSGSDTRSLHEDWQVAILCQLLEVLFCINPLQTLLHNCRGAVVWKEQEVLNRSK